MSNTLPIYANVPTLTGRVSKKKPDALKCYGGGRPTQVQFMTANGTALLGLRERDRRDEFGEERNETHSQWLKFFCDLTVGEYKDLLVPQNRFETISTVPLHGRLVDEIRQHPAGILGGSDDRPKTIDAAIWGLATPSNEDRPKKPLEWATKVYLPGIKSWRDSVAHMIEADGAEATPSDIATNNDLGSKVRYNAILEWLLENKPLASAYVLQELDQATDSWRDALVHAALDTFYDSNADRSRLANLLLTIASERRQDTDASAASVTRAAILRAGSLLDSSEINRLRPFLSESKSNLVALVAMLRIVSNDPPTVFGHDELIQDLRNTISRYSDPVTYRRGDIDAALFNALELLAIYSPEALNESLDDLTRLNKPYLFEQLHEELVGIQNSWQDVVDLEAGENLVQAIERVHQRMD